ncbi:MAG TPA: class I poly(R)-hydroxyalkanoic acid synthase [Quisquiliibacterium sp.]|nr:class I poly(R)-hydroxyalkanoic acid synthase [Quisquiliibacterium sp.]HQN12155.1 class I poly(R)-hydroxyalkanoic acid synthase [Quisquiliibacterium sp.]HQP66736.1 class I poly(R)-hydroxyalkanoic acid synthase [Quisquiliibacterium sp.]
MATAKQPGATARSRGKAAGETAGASTRRSRRPGTASAEASAQSAQSAPGADAQSDTAGAASPGDPLAAFGALFGALPQVQFPPARLAELQAEYVQRWQRLFENAATHAAPAVADKRFAHETWHDNGPFTWTAALYMLNAEFLQKMAGALEGEPQALDRIRFATQQWVDMMSPANFLATNPEAQRKLIETNGESLRAGLENLLSDMQRGRMSQTDEEAFEVGRNVATSPGAVVYQNDLIQLIQYAPSTERVGARPLLMVPPSINKFYIMDLQPDNSLVAFAASRGHTVFMVSWRNVGPEFGHLTWDDYLQQGVVEAIRVVREITGADTVNTLGFCVGGTILATALAALAARGEHPAETMTLMTTLLDFADPGVLGVFVDEPSVRMREQAIGQGGILPGKDLATTFSFLRPNDLVWNYYVNNYLKGERPPAFDLLYWNADSTNLPGPMYTWYLRHMYLQNELRIPDRLTSLGQPVDLRRIDVPTFIFGAREDHIVPWRAAHASTALLRGGDGGVRFVLGASGHIAGAINPASKNKRSYWTDGRAGVSADEWLASATEHPGSWWNAWAAWLEPYRGELVAAPSAPGSKTYRALESAPGSYVKARAV